MKKEIVSSGEHSAKASMRNLPISWKQGVEISNALRFHSVRYAREYLQQVVELRRPVAFTRHWRDVGHKPGMAAGRYPQKAAGYFLRLLRSVEANAQVKGLNTASLKITKLITNRAAEAAAAGRRRHNGKMAHLEIEVREGIVRKAEDKKEQKAAERKKPVSGKQP